LRSQGLSILFITHDLSLGYYISDRAVILYRGRIVEMGPTDRVYHDPLHPYTQMLMEAVPRLDRKWEEKTRTERESDLALSAMCGCVYVGRCPKAMDPCTQQEPGLKEAATGHYVACWAV
ncbi:MAG: ABC transporter ATP-binding protein, partial [Thermoflexia bacterium]